MRSIIVLAILTLIMSCPVYACCGGNTWAQYQSVTEGDHGYTEAQEAAEEYLKIKVAEYSSQMVDVNGNVTAQGYGQDSQSMEAKKLVSIIFMYDNDYNINNGGSGISQIGNGSGQRWADHKICGIGSSCHLGQDAQSAAQAAHSGCSHHQCHWDYIGPQLTKYTIDDKGS